MITLSEEAKYSLIQAIFFIITCYQSLFLSKNKFKLSDLICFKKMYINQGHNSDPNGNKFNVCILLSGASLVVQW